MSEPSPVSAVEPIAPEKARVILEAAITERCGEGWKDEESGWLIVMQTDYAARLTRGEKNVDFYVDLLGAVTIEEKPISPAQASGRLLAWVFLGLALTIATLIARAVGWM